MRHQAHHVHESLCYVGVPLALFALTFSRIAASRRASTARPRRRAHLASVAAAAAIAFAGGVLMVRNLATADSVRQAAALAADIDAIRALVAGRTVLPAYHRHPAIYGILPHFLHGARTTDDPRLADMVLRRGQLGLGESLTPRNNAYFLYGRDAWEAAHRRYEVFARSPPAAAGGDYQVHLVAAPAGDELLMVRRDCPFAAGLPFGPARHEKRRKWPVDSLWQEPARFFAHVYPSDPEALPAARRGYGFENLPFPQRQWVWRGGENCYTVRALPGYAIAAIDVGQFRRRSGLFEDVWQATIVPGGGGSSAGR